MRLKRGCLVLSSRVTVQLRHEECQKYALQNIRIWEGSWGMLCQIFTFYQCGDCGLNGLWIFFFFFFCGTGVSTQGLMLFKWVCLPLEPLHQSYESFLRSLNGTKSLTFFYLFVYSYVHALFGPLPPAPSLPGRTLTIETSILTCMFSFNV
jgi:hypothetical protein